MWRPPSACGPGAVPAADPVVLAIVDLQLNVLSHQDVVRDWYVHAAHAVVRPKHMLRNAVCREILSQYSALSVEELLHRCGFESPETDLDTLMSCCLLRLHEDGTLAMHDQLRDLAWRIVSDSGTPPQRSRLRGMEAGALLHANTVGWRSKVILYFSMTGSLAQCYIPPCQSLWTNVL